MEIKERVEDSAVAGFRNHGSGDLLWRHLQTVPAFRALLRAVEARFYQHIELPEPVLDVGCGDGHFAQMTFTAPLAAGIDPWWGPLQKARQTAMYRVLAQSMGDKLPFPDNCFASAFSNSVLEHIDDVQPVLCEINRVLQPGGRLVITTPSHYFTEYLGGANMLARIGLNGLANSYRRFFNFISRHAHTDSPEVWAGRLAAAGFAVERWQFYFSREALHALEWGHVQGLPSAVLHALTGHWILAPWPENLSRTERWLRPFYEEAPPEKGAYIFLVARKKAGGPIAVTLPPADPFATTEIGDRQLESGDWRLGIGEERPVLSQAQGLEIGDENREVETEGDVAAIAASTAPAKAADFEVSTLDTDEDRETAILESPISNRAFPDFFSTTLLLLSLALAIIAQSILSGEPPDTAAGLRWYVYSIIPLLIFAWRQRAAARPTARTWRLPRLRELPGRRWFYAPALLLAFVAYRLVAGLTGQQPAAALLLWLGAITVAFYSLNNASDEGQVAGNKLQVASNKLQGASFTLVAAVTLFLAALILRLADVSSHPFILDGIEASLGLEALNILNGQIRSPFATGWLTNPTLPLYLLAVPIQLFGRSMLALRLLSPLVGAVTVLATFLIGQRLWGRTVGLVAAVLLAGSHFHLHYSRLALTNIWDPLLVLVALGLIAIAWQRTAETNNRPIWLLAGVATGFNAYFFTASRLLPLMLAALFIVVLLFDRQRLAQQGRHVLALAALALIVALPQMLYYNNNPGIFMERANLLGILDGQSNWLAQEAARTGLSRNQLLWQQFSQAALAFNGSRDNSPVYRPPAPLLSFGPAVFFALGLAIAALRLRHLRYALLVFWVAVTVVFAGALLVEPPNSHRLIIAAPAVSLLAAIALVEFGRLLLAGAQRSRDVAEQQSEGAEAQRSAFSAARLPAMLVIVAVLLALNDVAFYFGRYRVDHNFADRNTEAADKIAGYLRQLDTDSTAYFYGQPIMYADFPTIPFLAGDHFQRGDNLFDVAENEAPPVAAANNVVFIFLPERVNELVSVEEMYPDGNFLSFSGYHADPLFHVYEVQR